MRKSGSCPKREDYAWKNLKDIYDAMQSQYEINTPLSLQMDKHTHTSLGFGHQELVVLVGNSKSYLDHSYQGRKRFRTPHSHLPKTSLRLRMLNLEEGTPNCDINRIGPQVCNQADVPRCLVTMIRLLNWQVLSRFLWVVAPSLKDGRMRIAISEVNSESRWIWWWLTDQFYRIFSSEDLNIVWNLQWTSWTSQKMLWFTVLNVPAHQRMLSFYQYGAFGRKSPKKEKRYFDPQRNALKNRRATISLGYI